MQLEKIIMMESSEDSSGEEMESAGEVEKKEASSEPQVEIFVVG